MTGKGRAGPIESLQRSGPVDSRVLTGPGAAKAGSEDEHAGVILEGTRVDEGGAAASVGIEPGQGDRRLQIIDHGMQHGPLVGAWRCVPLLAAPPAIVAAHR